MNDREHASVLTSGMDESRWADVSRAAIEAYTAKRSNEAATLFARARALRPGHLPTVRNLGTALFHTGRHAEALAAFDEALARHRDCAIALHGRGITLHAMGDHHEALESLWRAVRSDRNNFHSWSLIAELAEDDQERLYAINEKARALVELTESSNSAEATRFDCCHALIDAHRNSDAVQYAIRYLGRAEDRARFHDVLARAYYRGGHFMAAAYEKRLSLSHIAQTRSPIHEASARASPSERMDALLTLLEIMTNTDHTCVVIGGALLGLYRDSMLIHADRDVDIGILGGPNVASTVWTTLRTRKDVRIRNIARKGDPYYAVEIDRVACDVYIFEMHGNRFMRRWTNIEADISWSHTPFSVAAIERGGYQWNVPGNTERFLSETYGDDWQQPNAGFTSACQSPSRSMKRSDAIEFHRISRARRALLDGDSDKAETLIQLIAQSASHESSAPKKVQK